MSISEEQFNAMMSSLSKEELAHFMKLLDGGKKPKTSIKTAVKVKAKTSGPIRRTCKYNYHRVSVPHTYHCNLCGSTIKLDVQVDVLSKSSTPFMGDRHFQVDFCTECGDVLVSLDKAEIVQRVLHLLKQRSFCKELPHKNPPQSMNDWLSSQEDEEDYQDPPKAISLKRESIQEDVDEEMCPVCFGPIPGGCVCVD